MARERVHDHLDEFVDGVEAWRIAHGIDYDLIHAHYWLSGVGRAGAARALGRAAACRCSTRWAGSRTGAARDGAELEPALRIAEETRIVGAADRIVAASVRRARAPRRAHYGADPARIAVIPCGVDTDAVHARRPAPRPAPRSGSTTGRGCSTSGASRRSRGSTTLLDAHGAAARGAAAARTCASSAATPTSR